MLFSRLKPYETWEAFSSEAMRVWEVFAAIAQPAEIERLGVRFINHIAPIAFDDLPKYLKVPPKPLRELGLPTTSFLWQSRHEVPAHPLQVNVIQTIQPVAGLLAKELGLILDIEVTSSQPLAVAEQLVSEYLAKMQWLKDKAFFTLLKERAIKRFQGEIR